jgi:hypothetical protein
MISKRLMGRMYFSSVARDLEEREENMIHPPYGYCLVLS